MNRLIFHVNRDSIPEEPDGNIHVWLYGPSPPFLHAASVGAQALDEASRLTLRPSPAAIDFMSIAMAVTAADTFVPRSDARGGWSRDFEIVLPLANPDPWNALKPKLQSALRFLSSDTWEFEFAGHGVQPPPVSLIKSRQRVVDLSQVDCVSLFSGGLDSAIGVLDLLAKSHRPLLISHAYAKDAQKQDEVAQLLPSHCQRVSVNTYPTWSGADDDSMRTRSFQFLALGTVAAEAVAAYRGGPKAELYVCENGLIALNPPLTPRRMGSHSTRTAHPHFLESIQSLLDALHVPIQIVNPYRHRTKGEMALPYANDPNFRAFASSTVSCGKWKRRNQQCGRCVPCLIRRASLHAAAVVDDTDYQFPDLRAVMDDEEGRDDLVAVQAALIRGSPLEVELMKAGPLPTEAVERKAYIDVAARGLSELRAYLTSEGFAV
ncbi:hypothetical protein GIW81_06185 [Hyphomicrobium sp. xq]|uniref:7-cyano-7-deazaguanine synthase n=1 Tax=Hyphomicrobium album TaxID=2665159 RepID=A0A6I3KHW9_9HYPH|nr:Qat anti-phage system QueC-like protein QatC [Hyphomicrobium album]MTD93923.1 hypothetical protein [Hyphomicrobium album]